MDLAPLGEKLPEENPAGLGWFVYNLRFPGQMYDLESGLHYNYFRDYNPWDGRYSQSDPIGLDGGINTYAYVNLNPIAQMDRFGLAPGDVYPDSISAGIQDIKDINPKSIKKGVEYAGRIYKNPDGTYSYTKPRRGSKDTSAAGNCPPGTSNAGDYHTHGSYDPRYANEDFSAGDMKGNDAEGRPGFLGTPGGDIKVYIPVPGNPGAGKIITLGSGAK